MPRPGPRPYECVRRAWHSDRHQPMRGSIIQQIFKVVYENHNAVTKKNREWQEKLPVVVLKAEEIMYSKANSEAEYMDLGTLWDRVNDAVDTIIRKDETAETVGVLPPCVEAALNLGCVPVRASRSQRHSDPRSYLSPRNERPASSKVSTENRSDPKSTPWSLSSGNQLNLKGVALAPGSSSHLVPDINLPSTPLLKTSFSHANNQITHPLSDTPSYVGSAFPLYYGSNFQTRISGMQAQNPSDIIVGTPIFAPVENPSDIVSSGLMWHNKANVTAPNRTLHSGSEESSMDRSETECDLSLRLGISSDSFFKGKGSANASEGSDPNFSKGDRLGVLSASRVNEFNFFSAESVHDPSRLHLDGCNLEGEGHQSAELLIRKRKLPFHGNVDNRHSLWKSKAPSHYFADSSES